MHRHDQGGIGRKGAHHAAGSDAAAATREPVDAGVAEREYEFPCDNCGRILSAPASAAGRTGRCPACHERVPVPIPISTPRSGQRSYVAGSRRHVVHVSSKDMDTAAGVRLAPRARSETDAGAGLTAEVVIGWAAGMLAMILILIDSRAAYAYLPFLATAFLMGIRLLFGSRAFHGVVLLLCVCVSAPALMQQDLRWQPPWFPIPAAAKTESRAPIQPPVASTQDQSAPRPSNVVVQETP